MMIHKHASAAFTAILAMSMSLTACQKKEDTAEKGPGEKAGEQVDRAAAKAGEEMNKAGEKFGQALQKAGEKDGEAVRKSGEKLEGAARDAQKKE